MKAKYIIIGMCLFSEAAFSEVIFDVDSVPSHHVGHESIYVQMGSFKNEAFAHHLVRQIRTKNFQNVVIKPTHGELKVLVGPFVNQKELMHFYHVFHGYQSKKVSLVKVEPVKLESVRIQSTPKAPVISSTSSHPWYLNGQVGGQFYSTGSSTTVNNGSGFSSPYNQDIYSGTSNESSVLLGVGLGKRYELDYSILKAASLGVQYQYFFSNNVTGEITQFSLPEFKNYSYKWPVSLNVVVANAKFNFQDYKQISPYFSVGLGGVYHQTNSYSETAYANVTPRVSPNFSTNSGAQFAYLLGAGVDYPIGKQMIVSAGYQFSGLGQAKSGNGQGSWSGERLDFGRLNSNTFVFGATYLFDTNFSYSQFLEK